MYRRPLSDVLDVLNIVEKRLPPSSQAAMTVSSPRRAPRHRQDALDKALNLRGIVVGDEYMYRLPANETFDGDVHSCAQAMSMCIAVPRVTCSS